MTNIKPVNLTPIEMKQLEYNQAMHRYENVIFFKHINLIVSIIIIIIELKLIYDLFSLKAPYYIFIIIFIASYVSADFISGIAHLWADNNHDYSNFFFQCLL